MKKIIIALIVIIIAVVLGFGVYYFFGTGTEAVISTQEESIGSDVAAGDCRYDEQ